MYLGRQVEEIETGKVPDRVVRDIVADGRIMPLIRKQIAAMRLTGDFASLPLVTQRSILSALVKNGDIKMVPWA
jgi:hypothetical protein